MASIGIYLSIILVGAVLFCGAVLFHYLMNNGLYWSLVKYYFSRSLVNLQSSRIIVLGGYLSQESSATMFQ